MYGNRAYENQSGLLHTCPRKSAFSTRWAAGGTLRKMEKEYAGRNLFLHPEFFYAAWPAAASDGNHAPISYHWVWQCAAALRSRCGSLQHILPSFLFHTWHRKGSS